MKPIQYFSGLCIWVLLLFPNLILAQTASNICEEELLQIWHRLDVRRIMQQPEVTRMEFEYGFLHSENKEPVWQHVQAAAGRGQSRYMASDLWVLADANSTFTWFPERFVMYRTKPKEKDALLIKEIPNGIFTQGIATQCEFIPVPGDDTLGWKRIVFSLSYEGRKESGISQIEFISNPWTWEPKHVRIIFEPGQILVWAEYKFVTLTLSLDPEDVLNSPETFIFDELGAIRPEFKGAKLIDYR